MVIIGYIVALGYVALMIFGVGEVVRRKAGVAISRKIVHTSLFMLWCFFDLFFKGTIHMIIVPTLFIIINTISYKKKLFDSIEDEKGHYGTILFAVAVTIMMTAAYVWPEFYYPAGIGIVCLTFGDGASALCGYAIRSRKIYKEKTLSGFIGGIIFCFIGLMIFRMAYCDKIAILDAAIIAIVASILELGGGKVDNLTTSLGGAFVSWLLLTVNATGLRVGLIVGIVLFLLVVLSGAMTVCAGIAAIVMAVCFRVFGGRLGLWFVVGCYIFIFVVGVFRRLIRRTNENKKKKIAQRNIKQILINGGIGTVFIVIYGLTQSYAFLISAIVSIGGNFVDSVSSDVGTLSRHRPYDFLRRKFVETGISGGMSVLGTASAFLTSAAMALFAVVVPTGNVRNGCITAALIFAQTLIDSALGSLIQVKYYDEKCKIITEKKTINGVENKYYSGIRWVDNNMVNLISSAIVSVTAIIVFMILK